MQNDNAADTDASWIQHLAELSKSTSADLPLSRLYFAQQEAVKSILCEVQSIAVDSAKFRKKASQNAGDARAEHEGNDPRWRQRHYRHQRPHNVFVLDGERGSGKTTVILKLISELTSLTLDAATSSQDEEVKRLKLQTFKSERRTALVLPIIIPDGMLDHERPMAAVLAEVEDSLDRLKETTKDAKLKLRIDDALRELHEHVHVGWTFAQKSAQESLVQHSFDFTDYAKNSAHYSVLSYQRIEAWRGCIESILACYDSELLVLLFDDTDLDPCDGEKILSDVKQYLAHPRIVTILAADLPYLQRELKRSRFTKNSSLIEALSSLRQLGIDISPEVRSELIWDDISSLVMAILDKTMPPSRRWYLRPRAREDLENLFQERSLTEIFAGQFAIHFQSVQTCTSPKTSIDRRRLASAMEWWLGATAHSALFFSSIRDYIFVLHAVFGTRHDAADTPPFPQEKHRQLSEILAELEGLHRWKNAAGATMHGMPSPPLIEDIEPSWRSNRDQRRSLRVTTYNEHLCDYWFDVQLAANQLDARAIDSLRSWLPGEPTGVSLPRNRSSHSLKRYVRFGIAGYYDGSALPLSCLYLFQLRYLDIILPDVQYEARYNYSPVPDDDCTVETEFICKMTNRDEISATLHQYKSSARYRINQEENLDDDDQAIYGFSDQRSEPMRLKHVAHEATIPFLAYIKIFISHRKMRSDAFLKQLHSALNRISEDDRIEQLLVGLQNESEAVSSFAEFAIALKRSARDLEIKRHFYITMWTLAAHLAYLGNDFNSIDYPEMVQRIGVDLSASGSGAQKDDPLTWRLTKLLQCSERTREKSLRTRVLHAWSLCPIVANLFWVGDGDLDDRHVIEIWQAVLKLLDDVSKEIEIIWPQEQSTKAAGDPTPGTQVSPLEKSLKMIRIRDYTEGAGQKPPLKFLHKDDLVYWNFPDLLCLDNKFNGLKPIYDAIKGTKEELAQNIAKYTEMLEGKSFDANTRTTIKEIADFFDIGFVPAAALYTGITKARSK